MKKYKIKSVKSYKQGLTAKESLLISSLAREDKKIFSINAVSYTHLTLPTNREV